MRRYTAYMSGERFLADSRSKIVHDLEKEKGECKIDEIVRAGKELPFKNLNDAVADEYSKCSYCLNKKENNFKKILAAFL